MRKLAIPSAAFLSLSLVLAALAACAPAAAPLPRLVGAPTAVAPAPGPRPGAALTPEEAAWQKVVEAAKKEGSLTVYSATQFAGTKGRAVAEAFKQRYGISVELMLGSGRQLIERVKVEQRLKQPVADVTGTGTSTATEISMEELAAKVWPELPSFKDKSVFIADPVFDPDGTILNLVTNTTGPMINTNLVKPQDEPLSYNDFLDPKWKKKIIMSDPRGGGSGGFMWYSVMLAAKVLDEDYYRRFAQVEPQFWGGSSTEEYNMVGRGDYWMTPLAGTNSAGYIIVEGAPMKILGMKEGNVAQPDAFGVLKGAAHPNAARLFANWIFSQEGQTVYARAGSMTSMRKDVPDFLDVKVQIKPAPTKIIMRNWTISEETNSIHKSGLAERIFGKR